MTTGNRKPRVRSSLLRERAPLEAAVVTNIELLFDLVFAFAITRLSHTLSDRPTLAGALESAVLLLAVWWVWIYTAHATRWLDPQHGAVRMSIFVLMLAGLLIGWALPHAFEADGPLFAGCYVAMQVSRTLFLLGALGRGQPQLTRNFRRVTIWFSVSALLWIAGAQATPDQRLLLWSIAIAVDYGSVWIGFWVPGLGRSLTHQWTIGGEHLARRCSLFVTLALGESLLATGATAAGTKATPASVAAFVVAFVGSVAMGWLYFDAGYGRAGHRTSKAAGPGRIVRLGYTHLHLLIVAGIVVGAVGHALLLSPPAGEIERHMLAAMIGGPTLFLIGTLGLRAARRSGPALSHLVGFAMLAGTAAAAPLLEPLGVAALISAILVVVAAWETISLARAPAARPSEANPRSSLPAKIW
jgi:low temperature requirement protein LtrA